MLIKRRDFCLGASAIGLMGLRDSYAQDLPRRYAGTTLNVP